VLHFLANAMNIMHTVPERADALACGSRDIAMEAIDRDAKSAGARATVL
jgi:ribosomal protein S2